MGFSLFAELEKMEIMTLPNWFLTVAIIISVSTVFILIFVPEVRQTGQKSEDRKLTEDVESVDNDDEYSHLSPWQVLKAIFVVIFKKRNIILYRKCIDNRTYRTGSDY